MTRKRFFNWKWWVPTALLATGLAVGALVYLKGPRPGSVARAAEGVAGTGQPEGIRVEVVQPQQGGLRRLSEQPGTVQAFESAQLYAGVAGYLKTQTVDIGDQVKKGQVLARLDVPDLEKQVARYEAGREQARAHVNVVKAKVATARADWEVAKSTVVKAEAAAKSARAMRTFRDKQFRRMQTLVASGSIDERLADEKQEQAEAAAEAERAARAAILTAEAQVTAEWAKILQAEADVLDAEASVKVAQAELEKGQVMVQFASIISPYDGIITQRNFFPGDFIRPPTSGQTLPLLTVEQTDKMRMVVQVPDRDVPFTDVGDLAIVEIDALPGTRIDAKVSRIGGSEDQLTRLMRVEIDLPNPTGKIRQGMYGRVTIVLENSPSVLSIPSSCLVGKAEGGKGTVFVVREGRACQTPVRIGADNGLRVLILGGVKPEDQVVRHPSSALADGLTVVATPVKASQGR